MVIIAPKVGQTIEWINKDPFVHTATVKGGWEAASDEDADQTGSLAADCIRTPAQPAPRCIFRRIKTILRVDSAGGPFGAIRAGTSHRLIGSASKEDETMARCDQCGNDYDKAFQVISDGQSYTFDSFECAVQKLAPLCPHCGCRIIGHGVEQDDVIYCCAHCAKQEGAGALKDRA